MTTRNAITRLRSRAATFAAGICWRFPSPSGRGIKGEGERLALRGVFGFVGGTALSWRSPSPRPSPAGRGSILARFGTRQSRWEKLRRGFTLIELLVAMAIFGMILITIYSTWMMILRADRAGKYAAAEAQRERIGTRTIEEALSCVQSYNESLQYYGFIADNDDETLSFVARLPSSFPRSGRFGDLTTRRVEFRVEPDPEFGKRLVLRQAPIVMDFEQAEVDNPLLLAREVAEMSFEFWEPRRNEWVDEWTQTNQLPKMLKLNLRFSSGGMQQDREVSRIIALPSMTVPSLYQVGTPQQPGPPGGPATRPGIPSVQQPGGIR